MSDPYFDKVVLLLPMDGANNGTVFTDWSLLNNTVTRNGDVKTVTSQSKYYGSSGYFDGGNDWLEIPDSDNWYFGTTPFTIECWSRVPSLQSDNIGRTLVSQSINYSGTQLAIFFYLWKVASGYYLVFTFGNGSVIKTAISALSLDDGVGNWAHFAVSSTGSAVRTFCNGVGGNSVNIDGALINLNAPLKIGVHESETRPYVGHLQDIRITKGVARYTENFTPPTRLIGKITGTIPQQDKRTIIAVPSMFLSPTNATRVYYGMSNDSGVVSLRAPPIEHKVLVVGAQNELDRVYTATPDGDPFTDSTTYIQTGNNAIVSNMETGEGLIETPVGKVVIFDWTTNMPVDIAIPDTNGDWTTNIPVGNYGVTYIKDGYAPVTHGPYEIESG